MLQFSLRELNWMATSVCRFQWDMTSQLWALTANVNRDDKKQPKAYTPYDIHPLRKEPPPARGDIHMLKALLGGRN